MRRTPCLCVEARRADLNEFLDSFIFLMVFFYFGKQAEIRRLGIRQLCAENGRHLLPAFHLITKQGGKPPERRHRRLASPV
jgi:hypothetical protein